MTIVHIKQRKSCDVIKCLSSVSCRIWYSEHCH